MDTVVRRFAARIHNLRTERGLSQEALASRARLDPSYISALEGARKVASLTTIASLAAGLKVDIAVLVDFPESGGKSEDRTRDEIELVSRLLKGRDVQQVRKIRKAIEQLLA